MCIRDRCKRFRKALVSTSANISGDPAPANFDDISEEIKQGVDYIVKYRQDDTKMCIRDRGYLPQVMKITDERTVREEASLAFSYIFDLQAKIEDMNKQLETRTDYESDDYAKLIDDFTHAHERLAMVEDVNFEGEVEKALLGLGFKRADLDRPTNEFSGG